MPIISLQVNDELLERFEKVRRRSGFSSKSEALRGAIVNFIENHQKFDSIEGYKIMTINLVYPFKDMIIDEISESEAIFIMSIAPETIDEQGLRILEREMEIISFT